MAYCATMYPAWLCSRDGKRCYYGRLEYDVLVLFVHCFPLFSFSPSLSWYVYLLRFPSSVRQSSATLSKYVVLYAFSFLCHLRPASSWNSFVLFVSCFFGALISRVAFYCALVPGTSALDLLTSSYLDSFAPLAFPCLTVIQNL